MEKRLEHWSTKIAMSLDEIKKVLELAEQKMGTTINNLKKDLTGIHAGQVSPKMLDSLKIYSKI